MNASWPAGFLKDMNDRRALYRNDGLTADPLHVKINPFLLFAFYHRGLSEASGKLLFLQA